MAIYRLLKSASFSPETIACMTAAYEDALRVLRVDRQHPITELVAKKIILVTQLGESDPKRIRARALEELGVGPGLRKGSPKARGHRVGHWGGQGVVPPLSGLVQLRTHTQQTQLTSDS